VNSAKQALPTPEKEHDTCATLAWPQETSMASSMSSREGLQVMVQSSNNMAAGSQNCCEPFVEEPMTPESDVVSNYDIEDCPFVVEMEDSRIDSYVEDKPHSGTSMLQSNTSPSVSITTPSMAVMVADMVLQDSKNLPLPIPEPAAALTFQMVANNLKQDDVQMSMIASREIDVQMQLEQDLQNPSAVLQLSAADQVLVPDVVVLSSQELMLLPPEAASKPMPKLKNIGRLQTIHYVYKDP
jgi:hypothetical protein